MRLYFPAGKYPLETTTPPDKIPTLQQTQSQEILRPLEELSVDAPVDWSRAMRLTPFEKWTHMVRRLDLTYNSLADTRHPFLAVDPAKNERIALFKGNLAELSVDAIVCDTDRDLTKSYGNCADIHRLGGPRLD